MEAAERLCRERMVSLGYRIIKLVQRKGPFAALIFDISAERGPEKNERMIYKVPPKEREGEFKLIAALGEELCLWLPEGIVRFEEEPRALLMKYAGEAPLRAHPLTPQASGERQAVLTRVSERLAELHVSTAPRVERWVRQGKVRPYAYASEWAEEALALADRLARSGEPIFESGEMAELKEVAKRFYAGYSERSMSGPHTFTHGDPHWGNILERDGRMTFIDWEWSRAASPMRDIAILVQEEPDDFLLEHIACRHAERLIREGLKGTVGGLLDDFGRMMADNTLMMLGWELELFRRRERSAEETRGKASVMRERILRFWNRVRT